MKPFADGIYNPAALAKPFFLIVCTRAGPRYQLEIYRQAVTALVVNERIEMTRHKGMMVSFPYLLRIEHEEYSSLM